MSRVEQAGEREAFAELSRIRAGSYECLSARADAFFELADALLCLDGPVPGHHDPGPAAGRSSAVSPFRRRWSGPESGAFGDIRVEDDEHIVSAQVERRRPVRFVSGRAAGGDPHLASGGP